MGSISVIITTIFKKRRELKELLEDLLANNELLSEVSITFQRSSSSYYDASEVKDFLNPFGSLKIVYEIVDELNTSSGRNKAIARQNSDWIVIVDDDCRFLSNAFGIILKATNENQGADALTFCSHRPSKSFKNPKFRHSRFSIRKVSLIEIVLNSKVLDILGTKPFDEDFGLGCKWIQGEEQILLSDILKAGGKILHIPETTVEHMEESSGYILTEQSVLARGAMFNRMYGRWGIFMSFLFVTKKFFQGALRIGLLSGMRFILTGYFQYKKS